VAEENRPWSALERLLYEGSDDDIRRLFVLLRPAEIADLVEAAPEEYRVRLVRLMTKPMAADVLREVTDSEEEKVLGELTAREIAEIAAESLSDDAADLLGMLDPQKASEALEELSEEERKELRRLLKYGDETAGGIMQTEVVRVPADATVAQAIAAIKRLKDADVGVIHEVFVVDKDGRLVGTVSPTDLIFAKSNTLVRVAADSDPVSVRPGLDQEEIARIARDNDLATIPVVDRKGRLIGQILHDDIADVLQEEATEDIAKLAGADPDEFYDPSVAAAIRSRAVWLLPAFAGGLLVAVVMGFAEEDIPPELIVLLPVILGMAGNIGTQSSAITVRGIALGRIEWQRAGRVIRRQVLTGLGLGIMFSVFLFLFAFFSNADHARVKDFSLTAALAILAAMTTGAAMGVSVPLLLSKIGFDPAIAASPFVQTANDLTGAGILLLVARWLELL